LAVLIAACAAGEPRVWSEKDADAELERAEQLFADGSYRRAALAWEQAALTRPLDADRLYILAAEAWLQGMNPEQAEKALSQIDPAVLDGHDLTRLDLAQAELAMLHEDFANAGWLLASVSDHLPRDLGSRHEALELRLAQLQSAPVEEAIDALEEALDEPDFSGELALALLIEFPAVQLQGSMQYAGDRPELLPWLDLAIVARENLLDDPALAAALSSWQARWPELDYSAGEAQQWLAAWRQTRPMPAQITVLLPDRNSPLRRPGEALRDGLLAGWLQIPPDRRPELVFDYLGDEPESAVAAWFDARERGSDFLIGPLDQPKVQALAELPDAGVIPTLLLNLPDDAQLLSTGSGELAAIALPPEIDAEQAAIHALATGHRRALVLYQYSDWGRRVASAFSDTFRLGGGQIMAERFYDTDQPDYSFLLRETLKIDRSEERISRLSGLLGDVESSPRRRADIDLIFVGARPADGHQLLPQLRFFDAANVTLLSTSYIVDGKPVSGRDDDLNGVTLPMPPWFLGFTAAGAVHDQARTLYAGFESATLSRMHALGRDAMSLVPWLAMMRSDPVLTLPGMLGDLSLPDGHRIRRDLPVVELQGGIAAPAEAQ